MCQMMGAMLLMNRNSAFKRSYPDAVNWLATVRSWLLYRVITPKENHKVVQLKNERWHESIKDKL